MAAVRNISLALGMRVVKGEIFEMGKGNVVQRQSGDIVRG
jgi:hypothetical protein